MRGRIQRVCFALILGSTSACQSSWALVRDSSPVNMESHSRCGVRSPAEYFWDVERPKLQKIRGNVTPEQLWGGDFFRQLYPKGTLKKFSASDLRCWESVGDPLSSYLLAIRSIGTIYPSDFFDQPTINKIPALAGYLRKAATPRACPNISDPERRSFYGCETGLPEAQAALILCDQTGAPECEVTPEERIRMCANTTVSFTLVNACDR